MASLTRWTRRFASSREIFTPGFDAAASSLPITTKAFADSKGTKTLPTTMASLPRRTRRLNPSPRWLRRHDGREGLHRLVKYSLRFDAAVRGYPITTKASQPRRARRLFQPRWLRPHDGHEGLQHHDASLTRWTEVCIVSWNLHSASTLRSSLPITTKAFADSKGTKTLPTTMASPPRRTRRLLQHHDGFADTMDAKVCIFL